jgi:hypothetical protein
MIGLILDDRDVESEDTMNGKILYLPSTPLNLLISLVLAVHFREQQTARLILIDQRKVKDNPYYDLLKGWKESPFESVHCLSGQAKGSQKIRERRENFAWLGQYIAKWQPQGVAVGSDRRIEFQYVMALLQTRYQPAVGHYLDDGLYSYTGKSVSRWTAAVSGFLHRQVYGQWWREPDTIGASAWIQEAWVFQPQQVVAALAEKQRHELLADWFQAPAIRQFAQMAWARLSKQSHFPSFDRLLLLPHPNNAKKMRGYEKKMNEKINTWLQNGQKVAIKYHPRVGDEDPWALGKNDGVILLPSALATELLLPLLPNSVSIVGDVGTALLTARWLRPELKVIAQLSERDSFQHAFIPIMEKMGVEIERLT